MQTMVSTTPVIGVTAPRMEVETFLAGNFPFDRKKP